VPKIISDNFRFGCRVDAYDEDVAILLSIFRISDLAASSLARLRLARTRFFAEFFANASAIAWSHNQGRFWHCNCNQKILTYLSDSLTRPSYNDGLTNLRIDNRRLQCRINVSIVLLSELNAF